MAERLPIAPVPNPQVRAPQGPVTPQDISAPFQMLARAFQLEGAASAKQAESQEAQARAMGEEARATSAQGGALVQTGNAMVQEARANVQTSEEVNRIGSIVERDIAIPAAERAGRDAVRAGPDGTVIVDQAPFIFGPASKAYASAAHFDYLARMKPQMDADLTAMRLKYHGDPEMYQKSADAYVKDMMAKAPDVVMRSAIGQAGFESAGHNYRTALVEADNLNKTKTLESLKAQLESIKQTRAALAHQGGVDTPEYKRAAENEKAIYDKLVSDPRFGFTNERAQIELKASRDEDMTEAIIGDNVRLYRTRKNVVEAQRALQESLFGPGAEKLNIDLNARYKALARGQTLLERVGIEDKTAKHALDQTVTQYWAEVRDNPQLYTPERHREYVQKAVELADQGALQKLDAIRIMQIPLAALRKLGPQYQADALRQLSSGVMPALPVQLKDPEIQRKIVDEAKRQGIPQEWALMTVQLESGGNPLAVRGKYRGLFQVDPEDFVAQGGKGDVHGVDENIRIGMQQLKRKVGAFQDEFGRPPSATEVYLLHQQGEAGLRMHLANPDQPAWQSMAMTGEGKKKGIKWAKEAIEGNFPDKAALAAAGGVDGLTSRQFVAYWNSKVTGIGYEGSGFVAGQSMSSVMAQNPYIIRMWEEGITKLRSRTSENAQFMAESIVKDLSAGYMPPPETFTTFAQLAAASNRQDLIERKVGPALAAQTSVTAASREGPAALETLRRNFNEMRATQGGDPYVAEALRAGAEQVQKSLDGWQKQPLEEGVKTELITKLGPLTPGNPAVAAHELQQREGKQQILRRRGDGNATGPSTVINETEAKDVATALTKGPAPQAAQLLDAFWKNLSPDNRRETLAMPAIRDALRDMMQSRDPARMTPAFEILSGLWEENPAAFSQTYKDDTTTMVQNALAMRGTRSPQEIAEILNDAIDPRKKKAFDEAGQAAAKEFDDTYKIDNALVKLSDAWSIGIREFQRAIGTIAGEPSKQFPEGTVAARTFMADVKATYIDLRKVGVPTDKAFEQAVVRMRSNWGASPVDSQLMKNPPQQSPHNKPIPEYPNWMTDQVTDTITSIKGSRFDSKLGMHAGERPRWQFMGLISDEKTAGDMAAGRPPSYRIRIMNQDGTDEILTQTMTGAFESGQVDRVRFNRQEAVQAYQARATAAAAAVPEPAKPLKPGEGTPEQEAQFASFRRGAAPFTVQTALAEGQIQRGNIDLATRPVVRNADGSISTERSFSIEVDGKEYLIPQVSPDGRVLSHERAIDEFKRTGKHLGVFQSAEDADRYARQLSAAQGRRFGRSR